VLKRHLYSPIPGISGKTKTLSGKTERVKKQSKALQLSLRPKFRQPVIDNCCACILAQASTLRFGLPKRTPADFFAVFLSVTRIEHPVKQSSALTAAAPRGIFTRLPSHSVRFPTQRSFAQRIFRLHSTVEMAGCQEHDSGSGL
jgi:hypothetical protein